MLHEDIMKHICKSYNFNNKSKQQTCFAHLPVNQTVLINVNKHARSFTMLCVIEGDLSNFQKMTVFVIKTIFCKVPSE